MYVCWNRRDDAAAVQVAYITDGARIMEAVC